MKDLAGVTPKDKVTIVIAGPSTVHPLGIFSTVLTGKRTTNASIKITCISFNAIASWFTVIHASDELFVAIVLTSAPQCLECFIRTGTFRQVFG